MLAVLTPLLSLVGLEVDDLRGRITRQAIMWGLVAGLGLVAICFLLVALHAALSMAYGPVVAPLIIAAGALVLAVLVFLVSRLRAGVEAREAARKRRDGEVTALIATAAMTAIPLLLRSPLVKELGMPLGAALASTLWFRKGETESDGRPGRHR